MRNQIPQAQLSTKSNVYTIEAAHHQQAPKEFRLSRLVFILGMVGILTLCASAHGMATERIGPDSPSRLTIVQRGWFKGIVEPLRHPSRVYSIWVNGSENFYFQATPAGINELIALFSRARLRDHEILIVPGTNTVKSFGGQLFNYNVSLHILSGIELAVNREKDTAETFEPRLTIYVGDGLDLLKKLELPDNVIVRCEVESADIKRKASKPSRRIHYGCVHFDHSTPAVDMEHGLSTRITLWDSAFADGIPLASVGRDGTFKAVFSDDELADLKTGKTWLTVTAGNWLTEPNKADARFPAALLAFDKGKANPHKISRPQAPYYGRILFEDGSPPHLDAKPWTGAEIWADFPYAGRATLDPQGYFKVYLDPEQFAKLKELKPRENIYIPLEEQGRSRATEVFPPKLLSQDKAKAGVVKIARPTFKPQF